jgi:hypothetical protein
MSDAMKATVPRAGRRRRLSILTVMTLLAGWTTVFGDDFAGAAGSAPWSANWFYDIGTGYGTGETEQTTSSTSNVYLDGNGHLVAEGHQQRRDMDVRADREHAGRLPGSAGRRT